MSLPQEIAAALQTELVVKTRADQEAIIRRQEAANVAAAKAGKTHDDARWRHRDLQNKLDRDDKGANPGRRRETIDGVVAAADAARVAEAKLQHALSELAKVAREKQEVERAARAEVTAALEPIAYRGIDARIAAARRWDTARAESRAAEADYTAATAVVALANREGYQMPRTAELHATLEQPAPSTSSRPPGVALSGDISAEARERAMWNRPALDEAA